MNKNCQKDSVFKVWESTTNAGRQQTLVDALRVCPIFKFTFIQNNVDKMEICYKRLFNSPFRFNLLLVRIIHSNLEVYFTSVHLTSMLLWQRYIFSVDGLVTICYIVTCIKPTTTTFYWPYYVRE